MREKTAIAAVEANKVHVPGVEGKACVAEKVGMIPAMDVMGRLVVSRRTYAL